MIAFDYLASPGQLGNQMFKFSALKGIADNNGYDYLMPPSFLWLEDYKLSYKVFKKLNKYKYQNHFLFDIFELSSVSKKNIKFSNFSTAISPEDKRFDNNLFNNCPDNVQLKGFFQSAKYFDNISDVIKKDFTFKKKYSKIGDNLVEGFKDPVSIHIRRGDYVTHPNHFTVGTEYYMKGIDYFGQRENFLVFTDDPIWFKNQKLFSTSNFTLMSELTNNSTVLDLYIMSLCRKHIIANSTFSWWGAWLSGSKDVVFPLNWYKDKKDSSEDVPLKDWVGIDNNET